MDLSLLRGFAAGVRVELVGVVGARLAGVLLPGSVERVEFPEAVRRLEGVIARLGRDVVVDQVAYTWFNRLVALRFMDVNGYTGVGVVSPGGGALVGQPEVLADAKAGHLDAGVVGEKVRDRVIGLLSGSVVSRDGQGEAYKLLLAAYCNHWAGPMPFMFERSGDFTELLVPDDLLSERSIVARIVRTLTPEACADVEVIGWLYQFYIAARKDEVFAGFKKNKKATALEIPAATQLFTPHWIVKYLVENSLGRLWLLNNPGSDLGSRMEYYIAPVEPETDFLKISGPEELKVLDPACGSGHMLTYAFDLLFLMYEEAGYARSDIPGLILKHNLFGAEIDPRAGALAAFALSMKARDKQKSFLNPGKGTEPNICVLEPVRFTPDELDTLLTRGGDKHAETAFWQAFEDADTFGSLIRPNQDLIEPLRAYLESLGGAETLFGGDVLERAQKVVRQSEYLSTRYHVVVANPPYMGAKSMDAKLVEFAKRQYTNSKSDLFAMFIEGNLSLTMAGGAIAMVTMQSWMFLGAYEKLRLELVTAGAIRSMAHLGSNAFDSIAGEIVSTTAFIFERGASATSQGSFLRIVRGASEADKIRLLRAAVSDASYDSRYTATSDTFALLPGAPIAYWATESDIQRFTQDQSLGQLAVLKHGMSTSDNDRFMRQWYEVSASRFHPTASSATEAVNSGAKWFPFCKGGTSRRWYGNLDFVVNWENNGEEIKAEANRKYPYLKGNIGFVIGAEEFYFREAVTWSSISTSAASFRHLPAGSIICNKGQTFYPNDSRAEDYLLAAMNSSLSNRYLGLLSPTVGYELGYVQHVPIPDGAAIKSADVRRMIEISKMDWDESELSWDFAELPLFRVKKASEISHAYQKLVALWSERTSEMLVLENKNEMAFAVAAGVADEVAPYDIKNVTLNCNPSYNKSFISAEVGAEKLELAARMRELVSFAVGCMFGRYSLDIPGLVLADQGDTLAEYLAKVPSPSFMPDKDNVLPVLLDDWFEDDVVERFRAFLKASFGEEHFEENLRFVEESLGKDIRKYFVQDFYKDHVQRYKKRPIYWMFSSPKGSFNALIYMHRYRPDTVSVVLNDYLHEFQAKLRARRANLDQVPVSTVSTAKEQTAARKESEQIGRMLLELEEWEQNVLYPLATEQIEIDLDDGVKANYPKFGAALNTKYTGF